MQRAKPERWREHVGGHAGLEGLALLQKLRFAQKEGE